MAALSPACLPAAKTPAALVAPGWKLLEQAEGDLDGDGRPDAALALGRADDEKLVDAPRWLVVARRGHDGQLRPWAASEGPVLCRTCGGIFGDPLEGLSIRDHVLRVSHYGGSNWRWSIVDSFLWRGGAFQHIGKTHEGTFTPDPGYSLVRDLNLSTGYVIVTRKGMGLEGQQAFHELWAPVLPKLPAGALPGRPTRLVTAADMVQGRWGGQADGSASLTAAVVGDKLWIDARITDDHVTKADALRLVDAGGKVVAPLEAHQGALAHGWWARQAYPLGKLAGQDVLQASVEVVDDDPGRPVRVLSTSQGGRKYPAAIRKAATLLPPVLGGKAPSVEAFEDDPRLEETDS